MTTVVNNKNARTHQREGSNSSNLADEVVNLLDELLENEKERKPRSSSMSQVKNGNTPVQENGIHKSLEIEVNKSGSLNSSNNQDTLKREVSNSATPLVRTSSSSSLSVINPSSNPINRPSSTPPNKSVNNNNNNPNRLPTSASTSSISIINTTPSKSTTTSTQRKVPTTPNQPPPPPAPPIPQGSTTPKFKPSWSSALSFGSPSRRTNETQDTLTVSDLRKRIGQLEEEIKMADAFKRSLKETLGLQVESMRMDLELERERSKRLEYELSLKESDHGSSSSSFYSKDNNSNSNSFGNLPISSSSSSSSTGNQILDKLIKVNEDELKQLDQLKLSRQNNAKAIKDHEEKIQQLVREIKEESIFLITLREQKASLEKSKGYNYTNDQKLGGKLAVAEAKMKRYNEELEKERKIKNDLESGGFNSVVDKKLDFYINLHQEVIKSFRLALEEGGSGLKLQLEEVTTKRNEDREYFENKAKIFEKQFTELTNAKESLDREKELILNRLEEEKQSLAKLTQERELEANRLKADLEEKHKQLEDENVLLAEKMKQIRELQDQVNSLNEALAQQKSKNEMDQLAERKREVEEKQLQQKIDEIQSKNEELQTAFKKVVEERDQFELNLNTLQNYKNELDSQVADALIKLSETDSANKLLVSKYEELENTVIQQKTEITELTELKEKLTNELKVANDKINELSGEVQSVTSHLHEDETSHQQLLDSTKLELENAKTKIEELTKSVAQLSEEVEKEKRENADLMKKKNQLQEHFNFFKSMLDQRVKDDSS